MQSGGERTYHSLEFLEKLTDLFILQLALLDL